MLQATQIQACERTTMYSRPVFAQGIMQHTQHELTAPLDALVSGVPLRLPAGTVLCLTAGGAGGALGSLMTDVEFVAEDGETYRTHSGMQVRVPNWRKA